ncbi:MAG: hemolysin family protein [Peptoniphilaceae bacterium]|nr:hemolysin family protein [Peptoniphilaceae bacterium]MDY6018216.1 hemolysin family protein [Anaerococcus sp.]
MTSKNIIELIIIIIGIGMSAFFSSSETAMTSTSSLKLRQLEKNKVKNASLLRKLLDDIKHLITTILVGNNIVNIVTTTVATIFFTDIFGAKGAVLSAIVLTFLLLIFGEITPKMIAQAKNEEVALKFAKPIYISTVILKPIVMVLGLITNSITKAFVKDSDKTDIVTEEDIKTIVDVSEEQGVINFEESEMINNVFEFGRRDVSDIMTARTNMEAIGLDATKEELFKFLRESKHSRIPIYGESIDNIVGTLHMKDIVNFIAEGKELDLKELARPTFYAYENMDVFDLFKSMKQDNVSLAIVVDEYGGTSGLVSIEDIVEELVGDIYDEYDPEEKEIIKINDYEYLVNPSLHLNDFNDYFKTSLEEVKNDSIGGYLIDKLDRLPKEKDTVRVDKMVISVEKMDRYKLNLLRIKFLH